MFMHFVSSVMCLIIGDVFGHKRSDLVIHWKLTSNQIPSILTPNYSFSAVMSL